MSSSILPPLTPISSLTQPRGVVLRDELSGRPAHLLLKVEGLRFLYATPESAALDYATVSRVAPLLASIAAEETAGGSSVERAWHAAQAREKTLQLIAQLRALVEANLVAREFEIANASAIRLLRALIKLYGEGSVETLRAYLALAESSLGLGAARATATSSFLFAATSILLRATKGDGPRLDAITSRAKLAEGRLALLEGKPEVARAALARAVFHGACVAGADALAVAMPFFHLGRYFAGEGREVQALAAWEKTVEGARAAQPNACFVNARWVSFHPLLPLSPPPSPPQLFHCTCGASSPRSKQRLDSVRHPPATLRMPQPLPPLSENCESLKMRK